MRTSIAMTGMMVGKIGGGERSRLHMKGQIWVAIDIAPLSLHGCLKRARSQGSPRSHEIDPGIRSGQISVSFQVSFFKKSSPDFILP